MNLKRLLMLAVGAVLIYYVVQSPDSAASAFKSAGEVTLAGMMDLAEAIAQFMSALFR